MKPEYIILAVIYGSVIAFSLLVTGWLTFSGVQKWKEKRKIEQKRKHLRIIK